MDIISSQCFSWHSWFSQINIPRAGACRFNFAPNVALHTLCWHSVEHLSLHPVALILHWCLASCPRPALLFPLRWYVFVIWCSATMSLNPLGEARSWTSVPWSIEASSWTSVPWSVEVVLVVVIPPDGKTTDFGSFDMTRLKRSCETYIAKSFTPILSILAHSGAWCLAAWNVSITVTPITVQSILNQGSFVSQCLSRANISWRHDSQYQ